MEFITMKNFLLVLFTFCAGSLWAQTDSTLVKELKFTGDFRFRIEHDWNSRKSDGTYRADRSRLRYRFRFGMQYHLDTYSSFGARVRTGNLLDQQGPHVTLGANTGEFGLVSVGFEKVYYQLDYKKIKFWIGKNTLPLTKLHEVFWNNNVFPEGAGLTAKINEQWTLNSGHFIVRSNGGQFGTDAYFQMIQSVHDWSTSGIKIFPALYRFENISNMPEKGTWTLNYLVLHLAGQFRISKKPFCSIGLELYKNFTDYSAHQDMLDAFKDQTRGLVSTLQVGETKKKGDWKVILYLAEIQKYAFVDYFAQNDWARWDYSSMGATGSRLTNFRGAELRIVYLVKPNFDINLRTYLVEDLVQTGAFQENGSRIRLDMNIKF